MTTPRKGNNYCEEKTKWWLSGLNRSSASLDEKMERLVKTQIGEDSEEAAVLL